MHMEEESAPWSGLMHRVSSSRSHQVVLLPYKGPSLCAPTCLFRQLGELTTKNELGTSTPDRCSICFFRLTDSIVANRAFLPMRQRLIMGLIGRIPFMHLDPRIGRGRDKSGVSPPPCPSGEGTNRWALNECISEDCFSFHGWKSKPTRLFKERV